MEMKLGGVEVRSTQTLLRRMSVLIWGPSGVGKTTLAATAPKPILYVGFDPDGSASITQFDDIFVADFAGEPTKIITECKKDDPFGVGKFIEEHNIKTVVVDSTSELMAKCLAYAVTQVDKATIEAPTQRGYGFRNTYLVQAVNGILRHTGRLNVHAIFIAHEDSPLMDKDGNILGINIMLGGKMKDGVPLKFSEVWYMSDHRGERKIAVRPMRSRSPMKTRMFLAKTLNDAEFVWSFDADDLDNPKNEVMTIEDWYNKWVANDGRKIPTPVSGAKKK